MTCGQSRHHQAWWARRLHEVRSHPATWAGADQAWLNPIAPNCCRRSLNRPS